MCYEQDYCSFYFNYEIYMATYLNKITSGIEEKK